MSRRQQERKLIPTTYAGKLNEVKERLNQIGFIYIAGLGPEDALGSIMVAVENFLYMMYEAGGDVTEFVEGVLYEMFEEGCACGDDDE